MKELGPKPSSDAARKRMEAAKPKGTLPEIKLQSALEQVGVLFEVDVKPIDNLQRRADILIRDERIAIFVDGCFWHGCPIHGTQAKANAKFWADKINRNKERDLDTNRRLAEDGWTVLRIWEHEDPKQISNQVVELISIRRNKRE